MHNYGFIDATDVNVVGKLSNYLTFVEVSASKCNYDAIKNNWYIGKLTNGSTETLTLKVQIISAGTIENVVSVR